MRVRHYFACSALLLGVCVGCGPTDHPASRQAAAVAATGQEPSPPPITAVIVPKQFEQFHHQMLWFRSQVSNLALGLNIGNFKDSNFGTRVHDFSTGNGEYSCYPDDVLLSESEGKSAAAYAGYLRWQLHASISQDGQSASSVYVHKAGSGMLDEYIEPQILQAMSDSQAEVQVKHTLQNGLPWVETAVRIKNAGETARHFYWIYQDGVFLYLPSQNQRSVKPITPTSVGRYGLYDSSEHSWVGSFDADRRLASILYNPNPGFLFALPRYVLVHGIGLKDCDRYGFPCTKGGNDRFVLHSKASIATLLEQAKKESGTESSETRTKIHGLVMDFGELQPGEERTLRFYRLGLQGQSSREEISAEVARVVGEYGGKNLS